MNQLYREIMLSRIYAAVGAARAVQKVSHKGLKGQMREILIRDLFRPLFPKVIGVGTGKVLTSENQQSKQQFFPHQPTPINILLPQSSLCI